MSEATILVVEDNSVDRIALRRAFRSRGITNSIVEACDGVEALEHIYGKDGVAPIPRPFIVLTDIKMPRMDGHKLISAIRADEDLKGTVIFVLTTSEEPSDRDQAYAEHVTGYIVKQRDEKDLKKLVLMLGLFDRIVKAPRTT